MIAPAEIQRTSAALGVSPDVVEHDYALGCFLHFLSQVADINRSWVFKGGTCLAKCHYSHYRFSEDLDFTLLETLHPDAILRLLDQAKAKAQSEAGLRMDVRTTSVEIIEDDYGKESFEAKVYYQGIWRPTGSPRAIRVHANRDETLVFPILTLGVNHSYSDAPQFQRTRLQAYALEEIVAEKLRALAGQRRFAIARDLYDLWSLNKTGVRMDDAVMGFPKKCMAKGLNPTLTNLENVVNRREEFETNWKNNLEYLIPADLKCSFAEAWEVSLVLLKKALQR